MDELNILIIDGKKYYWDKLAVKVACPICSRSVVLPKLSRHQMSQLCRKSKKDEVIV